MSRLLSDLLGAREPGFTQHINRLEQASGNTSVDLHLSSDISKKVHMKLRELGLDPTDTNGTELYHGLQGLIAKHDQFLAKRLGLKKSDSSQTVIKQVIATIQKLPIPQTCWALKHSSAKRLLQQMPPKHVMKLMRYRSVDSLLKRANLDEVFAAIYMVEATSWIDRFTASYKRLNTSDFESRNISLVNMNPKYWSNLAAKNKNLSHKMIIRVGEMGVVAVLPVPVDDLPGLTITLLSQIIYHINKLRVVSSFLKLNQVKPDFNYHFVKAISGAIDKAAILHGQPVSWSVIHKHFGSSPDSSQSEVFAPHVQIEDLNWKQAEDVLFKLEPALKFWEGLDFVAAPFKKGPVPLGLLDNAVSYCNQLDYGEHSVQFFRRDLKLELFSRYLEQQALEDQITQQFDNLPQEIEMFTVIERGLR